MKGTVFQDGKNSRAGVKPKQIKRKCTENEEHIIQKMLEWDTKRGKKKAKRKKFNVTQKIHAKKSKDSACHWSGGQMPTDPNKLCKFQIKVAMDYNTKHRWFLSSSNLLHNDHPPVQI